jgi:hypothetical protein
MWSHILKQQLEVTVEEFWNCVNDGQLPDRGFAPLEAPPQSIPLFLLKELMKLGVSEKEALAMTPAQAAEKRVELLAASIIQD